MTNAFLQLVVTVWLGAHPVTFTAPHLYLFMQRQECEYAALALTRRLKPHAPRMRFECMPTDKRGA